MGSIRNHCLDVWYILSLLPATCPPPHTPAKEVKLSERKIFVILQMALELPLEILTGLLMPDFTFFKK